MGKLILFISVVISFSCSKETKEYTIENGGNKMTLKLNQIIALAKSHHVGEKMTSPEYYGTWRYIDEDSQIIETTIYGAVGDHIWTATPKDTFRIKGDKLIKEIN